MRPYADIRQEIPLHPQNNPTRTALIADGLSAWHAGDLTSADLRELDPNAGWAFRKGQITMTAAFKAAWAGLTQPDRDSALIRMAAVSRPVWHPSLIVDLHPDEVMSTTASTGAVVYFVARSPGPGHVFLTVTAPGLT